MTREELEKKLNAMSPQEIIEKNDELEKQCRPNIHLSSILLKYYIKAIEESFVVL